MFSLVDLLIVLLYMVKALVILAGAAAGLLAASRVAVLLCRVSLGLSSGIAVDREKPLAPSRRRARS